MERKNPSMYPSSSTVDRKTIEGNRRSRMRNLIIMLNSLVQHQGLRGPATLPEQLEEATNFIKRLQINLEKLRERKEKLLRVRNLNSRMRSGVMVNPAETYWIPGINVHQRGSTLEVNLITLSTSDNYPLLLETVGTFHEEGAEVVSVSFSVVGIYVFQTVLSEVHDSRPLVARERILQRLQEL
ncbi:hypothetical protein SAY87_031311 [Trapa incisa]|uniref:BHLH domain-containing protein n=1 Tax=Trapa incisa TaxID=236973 RepID=A0AAN7QL16_9MYRT|nr:hypothetical protein SAY87_031311 [Trapa incisa]